MADIFLSYAAEDRDRIVPLVDRLAGSGWTVWWDRELVAGPSFEQEIEQAIDAARCVVVAWSKHSINSHWCRAEAAEGLDRGILVPLRLDDVRPPLSFRGSHTASLLGWPRQAGEIDMVVAGVRHCLQESTQPSKAGVTTTSAGAGPRIAAASVAVLLAVAAATAYLLWQQPNVDDTRSAGADPESMAVLPFDNPGNEPALAATRLGLAEDVLSNLASWSSPVVASRTSTFRLAQDGADVAALADALNVHYVLEGSLRSVGERIRITVQLIRAEDGYRVWSHRYEREAGELLEASDPVARQIAHASRVWLLRDVEKSLIRSLGADPEALALTEAGYDQFILLANGHGGSWPLITDHYRRAVEIDADFWYAAHLLGNAYFKGAGRDLPVAESRRRATEALDLCEEAANATPAIRLGPFLCQLQRAQLWFFVDLDYAAAQEKLQELLSQQPGAFAIHWLLAMIYLADGKLDQARSSLAIADQVDHRAEQLGFLMTAAHAARWLGDLRESRDYAQRALAIVDNERLRSVLLRGLAVAELELGDRKAAERHVEEAWRLTGAIEPGQFTDVLHRIGRADRAADAYRKLREPPTGLQQEHYANWWSEGEVKAHLAMAEFAAAAASMKRYITRRDAGIIMMIRSDRALQPYRSLGWFSEVVDTLEAAEAGDLSSADG